ncbi:hypothetical protein [Mycolicibacterium fortuitum]|uniref:hypothetical protein n=2 Tax=Mycolicibacterium fortuitum TaxID=1766 RepID=UPI00261D70C5|nr:hypothetical protein [Mycolicibacterium fortuitum]
MTMRITVQTSRTCGPDKIGEATTDLTIEQRPYDAKSPAYLDWLTTTLNPHAQTAVNAAPGDFVGVKITTCSNQPELVGLAWDFKA